MTSHNEAQKTADLGKKYLHALRSLHHASISHDDTKELEAYVEDVEAEILEAQKTKADWLRSEIEKLEKIHENLDTRRLQITDGTGVTPVQRGGTSHGHYQAHGEVMGLETALRTLTSIITRYKEELLELEKEI